MFVTLKKFDSWSYSKYSAYCSCPLRAKLQYLDRIKEPPSEHLELGARVHEHLENYIKGHADTMPTEAATFATFIDRIRAKCMAGGEVWVEQGWSFDKDWAECDWSDWKTCWLRMKLDAAFVDDDGALVIVDWKTGKFKDRDLAIYQQQVELYAVAASIVMPEVQLFRPRVVFLKSSVVYPPASSEKPIMREQIPELKKKWEQQVAPMLADTTFPANPSGLCRFCHYRKDSTGHCEFGG